jgi:hypothetical protein
MELKDFGCGPFSLISSQVHLKSPKQAAFSGQLSAISNCCTYLLQHFESKILTPDP